MLKMLSHLRTGAVGVLLGLALAGLAWFYWAARGEERKVDAHAVLSILQSQPMNFLVTERLATTVVLDREENSIFFGMRYGILIADVEVLYGFDLQKILPSDIRTGENGAVVVKMPKPEMLRTIVNLDSMRYFTKQTNLSLLADKFKNRDLREDLRKDFVREAERQFAAKHLLPNRRELLMRLDEWAVPLFERAGIKIEFE